MLHRKDNVTAFPGERRALDLLVDRAAQKRKSAMDELVTTSSNVIPFPSRDPEIPIMVFEDGTLANADALTIRSLTAVMYEVVDQAAQQEIAPMTARPNVEADWI